MRLSGSALALAIVALLMNGPSSASAAQPKVLFDAGHAQKAGNADWVIDGGFSDFAGVFSRAGCAVSSIDTITPEALKDAKILVLPEPNSAYTPQEEQAIVDFVNAGGGLYAIGDHDNSDRNGDGIDSVGVLNRFLPKLGLQLEKRYFSEAPAAGAYTATSITRGVKAVGTWGGTSVRCLSSSAQAHIRVSAKNGGEAYIATNVVGKGGKVIAMGDSSPYDDGTGDPRDKLHNGFSNPKFQHDVLAANTVSWLLAPDAATVSARATAMTRNLRDARRAFLTAPSEGMAMFLENTEANLKALVRESPEIRDSLRLPAGSPRNLGRELDSLERFKSLHRD